MNQTHQLAKVVLFFIIGLLFFAQSCKTQNQSRTLDEETWKLSWRMIENSWDENYHLADLQFDSLLAITHALDERVLINGLKTKVNLSKESEVVAIISRQSKNMQLELCANQFAKGLQVCQKYPKEKVENPTLQLELIKLYVDDQSFRGNVMHNMISKYQIDTSEIKTGWDMDTDEINRNRLKEIISEFGFPTRQLVGRDAMSGVFYIIQHADGDKDWQKTQLLNIELAVKKGDMVKEDYAYLYDRIKVNHDEPQRYGTQILNIDPENKIVELKETEDMANLNQRRRSMGMMPIETYKKMILKH